MELPDNGSSYRSDKTLSLIVLHYFLLLRIYSAKKRLHNFSLYSSKNFFVEFVNSC